jgi:lipoate-protein ligase B
MNRFRKAVRAYWLGRIGYRPAWDLQRALVEQVRAGEAPSTVLLLEHEHVFSMGRRATLDHVLWDEAERERRGVEVVWTDRGGDVTYHGPGQLVGYPILDLPALNSDILSLIRGLERSLISYLGELGIETVAGDKGYTGVWTPGSDGAMDKKMAAIGVKLNHHVSNHGFALNVDADLDYFGGIVPCGIEDKPVTSVAVERGTGHSVEQAGRDYLPHLARAIGCEITLRDAVELEGLAEHAPPEPPRLRVLEVR